MKLKKATKTEARQIIKILLDSKEDPTKLIKSFLFYSLKEGIDPVSFYEAIEKAGYYSAIEKFKEQQAAKTFIKIMEDSGNVSMAARGFVKERFGR